MVAGDDTAAAAARRLRLREPLLLGRARRALCLLRPMLATAVAPEGLRLEVARSIRILTESRPERVTTMGGVLFPDAVAL